MDPDFVAEMDPIGLIVPLPQRYQELCNPDTLPWPEYNRIVKNNQPAGTLTANHGIADLTLTPP